MRYEYLHPRDELVLTMQRIYRYKMTTTSGGNLSIRDENGVMVVGESVLSAFDKLEVLEHSAEAVLDAQPIGGHVAMSQKIIDDLIDAFHLERATPPRHKPLTPPKKTRAVRDGGHPPAGPDRPQIPARSTRPRTWAAQGKTLSHIKSAILLRHGCGIARNYKINGRRTSRRTVVNV